jgi:predicted nucleic acid-binding protein
MECVLDTNTLIYDTIQDSEHHKTARALIDSIEVCVIPSVVLEEFVAVLAKLGVDGQSIYEKVVDLLESFEYAPVEKEDVLSALESLKNSAFRSKGLMTNSC